MLTRQELIRHSFTKQSKLIEIGASYNPIVPKSEGWQTTIIDHADQATLRAKYHDQTFDNIEPVDAIWTGEPLESILPAEMIGQYDGLIASHVGEHMPDFIGFLKTMDRVLQPNGVIALALPDKRVCFDFFRPASTTGMLLDAHFSGRTRHTPGQIYDSHAYFSTRFNVGGWMRKHPLTEGSEPHLTTSVKQAFEYFTQAQTANDYIDAHGWCFTPTSFQLIMLELHELGISRWRIARIEPAGGVEFYVWLERGVIRLDAEAETQRYRLLMHDARDTAADTLIQLTPPPPPPPAPLTTEAQTTETKPIPTISAVVPLYNGGRFIADGLCSILNQTLPVREILVVNDGSVDDGAAIVRTFQADHPDLQITLINQNNAGQSAARNKGVLHAKGDLIAMMDQDDEWYPGHLEELVKPFVKPIPGPSLGWSYSNLDQANPDGSIMLRNWLTVMQPPVEHPKSSLINCLNRDMFVLPTASLILRKAFVEVGGFDENLSGYEDDDLFMRIFRAGYGNVWLNMPLSKWRQHKDSASHTFRMARSRNYYCAKLLRMFPDDPDHLRIFYTRDVILPRFYPPGLVEYRNALHSGDSARITETYENFIKLLNAARAYGIFGKMSPAKARLIYRVMLAMPPPVARKVYLARMPLRPLLRRALPI